MCRKYSKALLKTKEDPTTIRFSQEEDGDLYFTWGDDGGNNQYFLKTKNKILSRISAKISKYK